jgi:hypothetical protein
MTTSVGPLVFIPPVKKGDPAQKLSFCHVLYSGYSMFYLIRIISQFLAKNSQVLKYYTHLRFPLFLGQNMTKSCDSAKQVPFRPATRSTDQRAAGALRLFASHGDALDAQKP